MDSDPAKRNVFGLIAAEPELARGASASASSARRSSSCSGGKKIHPAWSVPGGVREPPLPTKAATTSASRLPEAFATAQIALEPVQDDPRPIPRGGHQLRQLPARCSWAWSATDGNWEHYDGKLRFVDADGEIVADQVDPAHYQQYIGEAVQPDSYLKSPYYKPLGYPEGIYRVGPLARLNVCTRMGVPAGRPGAQGIPRPVPRHGDLVVPLPLRPADRDPGRARADRAAARRSRPASRTASAPTPASTGSRAWASARRPRGTLFHHYQVDEDGLIKRVNLIIATGQNNLAMNRTVAQIAEHYINGPQIPEGVLNRLEAGIRAFDPCLSCSTHAVGHHAAARPARGRRGRGPCTRSGVTEDRGSLPMTRRRLATVFFPPLAKGGPGGVGRQPRRPDRPGASAQKVTLQADRFVGCAEEVPGSAPTTPPYPPFPRGGKRNGIVRRRLIRQSRVVISLVSRSW